MKKIRYIDTAIDIDGFVMSFISRKVGSGKSYFSYEHPNRAARLRAMFQAWMDRTEQTIAKEGDSEQ